MGKPRHFSEEELRRARELLELGATWTDLGKEFGCDGKTVRRKLDPLWGRARNKQIRAANRRRTAEKTDTEAKDWRISMYNPDFVRQVWDKRKRNKMGYP